MTTDTKRKQVAVRFHGDKLCTSAVSQRLRHDPSQYGDDALCHTDADIARSFAEGVQDVADETFNMVSVDGDTRQTICLPSWLAARPLTS
ncbi:MAG: hypothetical protein ACLSDO_00655 [Anaerotruncus colihominis]